MKKAKKKSSKKDNLVGVKILGVGGSGGNIVNRMYKFRLPGINFFAINTDLQALKKINGPKKIQIGKNITRGLGAGMNPEIGRQAAEENKNDIENLIKGSQIVFITCGLGGGTGSGAVPVIAEIAKNLGILTIVVVTTPFTFEGKARKEIAEGAIQELQHKADTLLLISNDRLIDLVDKEKTLIESFSLVDDILKNAIIGISGIILLPGLINIDFADVKTIMEHSGQSLLGVGRGEGDNRAIEAVRQATENPFLDLTLAGAKRILFSIRGSKDLKLHEVNEIAKHITFGALDKAKIIFGAVIDDNLKNEIEVTVIASSFVDSERSVSEKKEFVPLSPFPESLVRGRFSKEPTRKSIKEIYEKTKEEEELEVPAFIRKKIKY
ncbi:MAG: cell division protein FtsZ [Ignavibacterium sp.]|nr:cell division protein FtsZ [Ignavibacterium sp.]